MEFSTLDYYLKRIIVIETHKKENIRRDIAINLYLIGTKLPINMYPEKNYISPYFVSFDIPETKNEAFIHIEGMADGKILLHLDVVRKGTQKVFSHYLKGIPESELPICLFGNYYLNKIFNSVIFLSKKTDDYWKEH